MDIKNPKIREIFENMSYGELPENFGAANQWFKDAKEKLYPQFEFGEETGTISVSNPEVIDNIFKSAGKVDVTFGPNERAAFLIKFANEIEKNASAICQIEAKTRGILIKDTQSKVVPYLIESLRYYSGYAVKSENHKLQGTAVHAFCDQSFLGFLGATLGPALAVGYHIILQTAPKISAVVAFIIKLAKNVGCPDNVFTLIPGNTDIKEFLNNDTIKIISVIDNFFSRRYSDVAFPIDKNLLAVATSFRTPMIVFSNADLDSACESLIDAAWSYQGFLPWSVNQLLVQESIFSTFVKKLKSRLTKVKTDEANKKIVDIALPKDEQVVHNIQKMIFSAKQQGLEVFQINLSSEKFQPTLIIGGRVYGNNVLTEDDHSPVVTVLAFRTASEAVSLANNSRQGLAASVWTENIDLAEEVARALKVTNVWINTHGNFTATAPITFQKMSGVGSFGGKEGFLEYSLNYAFQNGEIKDSTAQGADLHSTVVVAKKAQSSWVKLSMFERYRRILNVVSEIEGNKEALSSDGVKKFSLFSSVDGNMQLTNIWVASIYESLSHMNSPSAFTNENYSFRCFREPLGCIAIEITKGNEKYVVKTILTALLQGNSVILLIRNVTDTFYSTLAKLVSANVPVGVFNIVKNPNYNTLKMAAMDKELNAIAVGSLQDCKDLFKVRDMKKVLYIADSWEIAVSQTSVCKNVWSTVQQSFL